MAYRAIVDTVGHSESLAKVGHLAERLYWRLVAHSDAHGRVPGSPSKTRAMCFPLLDVSHEEVGEALCELEEVERIWVYEVDGVKTIQIVAFDDNQPKEFLRRRGTSRLPESPTLKSGMTSEHSRTIYKLPAKPDDSGTTPANGGSAPSPKELKERKRSKPNSSSSTTRAGATPETGQEGDAAAEEILEQLTVLGITGDVLQLGLAEPDRAEAWLELAADEAESNAAGFVANGLRSKVWPSERNAAGRPAKGPICPQCGLEFKGRRTLAEHMHVSHDEPLPDDQADAA